MDKTVAETIESMLSVVSAGTGSGVAAIPKNVAGLTRDFKVYINGIFSHGH